MLLRNSAIYVTVCGLLVASCWGIWPRANADRQQQSSDEQAERSRVQAQNRKAIPRPLPESTADPALPAAGSSGPHRSGTEAVRDFLPRGWWFFPTQAGREGREADAFPAVELEIEAALDDSEGTADPVGKTLSGAGVGEEPGSAVADPDRVEAVEKPDSVGEVTGADLDRLDPERPAIELAPLTPRQMALRDRLREVRAIYREKHLNTRDHGHWETMHYMVAYGVDSEIRVGSPYGEKANAIGWICWNNRSAREPLFQPRADGFVPRNGPGLQGHDGQFLAIIAQVRLKKSYPMWIGGREFTIEDLIAYEQRTCEPGTELTFKLIGLNHYLEPDAVWTDARGREWSIERLVQEELKQPIIGATCGGTHRLFGLSAAYQKRERLRLPVTGHFYRAKVFIEQYHDYAWKLQNPDGSFSTNWFAGRGDRPDPDRKLQTTGHIAEWLAASLPREQLESEEMLRAIEYVTNSLYRHQNRDWRIGPLGHALHALQIYDQRMFVTRERMEAGRWPAAEITGDEPAPEGETAEAGRASIDPAASRYAAAAAAGQALARRKQGQPLESEDEAEEELRVVPYTEPRPPAHTADLPAVAGPELFGPR